MEHRLEEVVSLTEMVGKPPGSVRDGELDADDRLLSTLAEDNADHQPPAIRPEGVVNGVELGPRFRTGGRVVLPHHAGNDDREVREMFVGRRGVLCGDLNSDFERKRSTRSGPAQIFPASERKHDVLRRKLPPQIKTSRPSGWRINQTTFFKSCWRIIF